MVNQNNILPRVLPFAIYILFLALSDYLSPLSNILSLGSLTIDTKWLYTLRVVLVLSVLLFFFRSYSELKVVPAAKTFLVAILAGLLVFMVWILPYPAWAGVNNHAQLSNAGQDAVWMASRLIGAAIIVPVM